jgi:hypothetical protein
MTVGDLAALMTALATLASSLASLYVALSTRRNVGVVKDLVNGQSDKLNTLTAATSFAAGVEHGRHGVSPPRDDPSAR